MTPKGRLNAFVPAWHPPEGGTGGGGNVRAKEIVEGQSAFRLFVADTDTTDFDESRIAGTVTRAKLSWCFHPRGLPFKLMRALNWLLTCAALTARGLTIRERIDFVYVPYSELIHVSLAGFIVAHVRRVPVVFCNFNVRGVAFQALNRVLHRHVDGIITLSHALAQELRDERIGVPIRIGLVGVEDASVPREQPAFDGIYVGRHTAEKGIFDILRVWAACCRQNRALRLALVGPCTEDIRAQLGREISALGLTENVTIFGTVGEPEKWELYAKSRLCVFPSHVEGWGIVPIEAHLAGIPVVAYDLPAYEETIRHSVAASLVPDGDVEAMAGAILQRLAHPLAEAEVEAVRGWSHQFTWARAVEREEELILATLPERLAQRGRVAGLAHR